MHQFKSGDYIMVKNHESERWTHGCVDVVLSQKNVSVSTGEGENVRAYSLFRAPTSNELASWPTI